MKERFSKVLLAAFDLEEGPRKTAAYLKRRMKAWQRLDNVDVKIEHADVTVKVDLRHNGKLLSGIIICPKRD